jgi:hypothetical protein
VPDPARRAELETLRKLRKRLSVPRGMPPGVLDDIEEQIRALEEELYPTLAPPGVR